MRFFKNILITVAIITVGYFPIKAQKVCCYSVWGETYFRKNKENFFKSVFKEFEVVYVKTLQNLDNYTYIITEEVPRTDEVKDLAQYPKEKVLLFSFETQISNPRSHDPSFHKYYSKIFTWNDDFIDNITYFKVRYPWMDPRPILEDRPSFENKKLCVFVGNNYKFNSIFSNYNNRVRLEEFFEKNAPNDLDIYGTQPRQSILYKGPIEGSSRRVNKINCIKYYKFDICYENTIGVNGWVSERIFECFSAGCIPVYSGSNNIRKYIPEDCFIDANKFSTNLELYTYLKKMSKEEYNQYIENIQKLLSEGTLYYLSTPYFIENIRKVLALSDAACS